MKQWPVIGDQFVEEIFYVSHQVTGHDLTVDSHWERDEEGKLHLVITVDGPVE